MALLFLLFTFLPPPLVSGVTQHIPREREREREVFFDKHKATAGRGRGERGQLLSDARQCPTQELVEPFTVRVRGRVLFASLADTKESDCLQKERLLIKRDTRERLLIAARLSSVFTLYHGIRINNTSSAACPHISPPLLYMYAHPSAYTLTQHTI